MFNAIYVLEIGLNFISNHFQQISSILKYITLRLLHDSMNIVDRHTVFATCIFMITVT